MGGIKNKLNKLSNKAKTLFSNLTSPSRGGGLRSKPVVSLSITKYVGIACLSLAILSTLVLNIVSSYSLSKIESNAESVGSSTSTLANDSSTCDPTNTNAAACISLSIISSSSSSTGGNDANLSLSIPQGGGIATGRHTVEVSSNSYAGWSVSLTSKNGETDLVNNSNSKYTIPALPSTATVDKATTLANNTYGVAFPYGDWITKNSYNKEADYLSTDQAVLSTTRWTSLASLTKAIGIAGSDVPTSATRPGTRNIYYGVRIDNPASFPAGDYSTSVVYTATVNLPPTPSNLSVNPTTFEFDSCNDSLITIEGTNLSSVYEVYLQKSGTTDESNRLECTNLNVESSTKLTCNIPTSRDEVELNTTYDIYVISQAANPGVLKNAFTYTEPATGLSIKSTSENIIVDYDENLIPVVYVGYNGNGGGHWESLTKSEITSNTDNWFNYTNKQWANAVTVTKDSLSKYQDKHTAIDNNDVLGYWVYIPRYAYEVQRRDAVDKNVDPQNFDIVFQTADEKNIPIATSSTGTNHKDYRTSNSSHRTYSPGTASNPNSNTTWATNPAFTWGDTELNGIWVGKFEMTGTRTTPTVKPNQHANINESIGNFYSMARSIGKEDKCNVGGGSSRNDPTDDLVQNSHNLATTKSHMLKNSEWGAITYLAHSKYGAGINTSYTRKSNVSKNGAVSDSSDDADGDYDSFGYSAATGCGPVSAGSIDSYNSNIVLNADTIESGLACGSAQKAYNGRTGILASTTNNVYGVYDTAGGVDEYVMGNRTTSSSSQTTSDKRYFKTPAKSPYVDLYVATPNGPFGVKPSWSSSSAESAYNNDVCTFETCGGTATYETTIVQSVYSGYQSWGGATSFFVYAYGIWASRGETSFGGNYASPFSASTNNYGVNSWESGSRAALLALPTGQ